MAVVLAPQPQHVLGAVEELGEAVKLAVAEVDGSLEKTSTNQSPVPSMAPPTRPSSRLLPPGRLRPATWCRCGGPGRAGPPADTGPSLPGPSGGRCGCPGPPSPTGRPADTGPGTAGPGSGPSGRSGPWTHTSPGSGTVQRPYNLSPDPAQPWPRPPQPWPRPPVLRQGGVEQLVLVAPPGHVAAVAQEGGDVDAVHVLRVLHVTTQVKLCQDALPRLLLEPAGRLIWG